MSANDPEDLGTQNERTALSWERTALSLAAASLVVARLTFGRLGPFALLSVLIGLPVAFWVFVASRHRHRRDSRDVRREQSPGGRAPAALTAVTTVLVVTELAAILVYP